MIGGADRLGRRLSVQLQFSERRPCRHLPAVVRRRCCRCPVRRATIRKLECRKGAGAGISRLVGVFRTLSSPREFQQASKCIPFWKHLEGLEREMAARVHAPLAETTSRVRNLRQERLIHDRNFLLEHTSHIATTTTKITAAALDKCTAFAPSPVTVRIVLTFLIACWTHPQRGPDEAPSALLETMSQRKV